MCTVSFLPHARGFHLAMNRDETRSRARGLPPAVVSLGRRRAILPREPEGGTWIAVNEAGLCLALINWYRIDHAPKEEVISRGIVVVSLAGAGSLPEVAASLGTLPLRKLRPFRLLAVDAKQRAMIEWRWDLQRLRRVRHGWQIGHWFSSGFDEPMAERIRGAVCAGFAARNPGEKKVRELHRSHAPRRGPFSICMHRKDAATVSYAEVAVSASRATMRYSDGPPCSGAALISKSVERARSIEQR